ncbi:FIG00516073: hypothetical protein [Olavius sp. associated proteobacterium Delta 1]|nr:FIG00516073: hypothetical protein [Olavius sp. associated proteobacterium Delta 1]
MKDLSKKIEKIILQHGARGMDRLQETMNPGYCQRAAQMILDNRGAVIIGTGFPVSGSFESDGPISAISLYRVLTHLDYEPVFACAPPISKILSNRYSTYELPLVDWNKSRPVIKKALADLNPSLVVSIERPGVAADGRYYNMNKEDITEFTAKFDLFFQECQCPCIAFGDGGNEIGMGNVIKSLSKLDIIPSVTTCDELIIASVSNWGVYGVIAALCDLLKRDLFELIDPESTANYLVANGCVDGVTNRKEASEDGFPIEISKSIIQQLRSLIF